MVRLGRKHIIPLFTLCCSCLIVNTLANQIVVTSVEKNTDNNGQQLYNLAIEQLQEIEKRHSHTQTYNNKPTGYLQYLFSLFEQTTEITTTTTTTFNKESHQDSTVSKEYHDAITLLQEAATTFQNNDALLLLAELNFFSKYAHPRNYQQAFRYYNELAGKGNATAQYMLGFMHTTGIGVQQKDEAKGSIYYTFAAEGGDTLAEMTLGYRHLYGIHTDESCEDSLRYYRNVAEKAIRHYLSGPPLGRHLPFAKVRLPDEQGGIYGFTASPIADKKRVQRSETNMKELMQYWKYLAESEDDKEALLMLGKVYYFGTRDIPRDYTEAIKYFKQIADKKLLTSANRKKEESKILGQAAGYLGLMHWRGEGVPASVKHAYEWFKFGLTFDDPASQNAIGLMYKSGIGIDKDQRYALHYFKAAASQNHPDAMVNLALEYAQDDITLPTAIDLLTKAAEKEHLLAYWYLGQLNDQGYSSSRSCRVAVHYYKAISEIGDWLHPTVEQGYNAYKQGDHESALLFYTLAAERGYEVSQSNVAYLLDPDKRVWDFRSLFTKQEKPRDIEGERTAFTYWSRAAHQSNIDARVKMCDYYYKGIGTKADPEKAAACYRNAAENGRSSLAYWNLGWMYENGIGVKQDFPLAKRAYDNALATWPDAYLPVKLSLLSCLRKWWWHRMTSKDQ